MTPPSALAKKSADQCLELIPRMIGLLKKLSGSPSTQVEVSGQHFSMAQMKIMWLASRHDRLRMTDAAKELNLRTPTATHHVNALVKLGLVTRSQADGDRRGVTIALTPTGQRLMSGALDRYRDYFAQVLGQLSPASLNRLPRAIEEVTKLLEPIVSRLDPAAVCDALKCGEKKSK